MKYFFTVLWLLVLAGSPGVHAQQVKDDAPAAQKIFYGQASFYADKFAGRKTYSGEVFDQKKMTCACNAVKIGTWLRITNVSTRQSVIVKVNDRIHPKMKRVVDMSSGAAKKIGITKKVGVGRVKVEVLGDTVPAT